MMELETMELVLKFADFQAVGVPLHLRFELERATEVHHPMLWSLGWSW
jgi:hypothetical protein